MLAALFWGSFVLALTGALAPGPMLTATISESARRGFWSGPLIVLGHGVLEALLLSTLLAGVGEWLKRDAVLGALGLAGGFCSAC
jgi:threonine/homoserine/homoserine lactone efflux protein